MEPTVNPTVDVTVVHAASVEPVFKLLADTIKLNSPYLAHCQSDRAKRLEALRKETHQYTPDKTGESYRPCILEVKAMMKTSHPSFVASLYHLPLLTLKQAIQRILSRSSTTLSFSFQVNHILLVTIFLT
jgi:hypothetical protein